MMGKISRHFWLKEEIMDKIAYAPQNLREADVVYTNICKQRRTCQSKAHKKDYAGFRQTDIIDTGSLPALYFRQRFADSFRAAVCRHLLPFRFGVFGMALTAGEDSPAGFQFILNKRYIAAAAVYTAVVPIFSFLHISSPTVLL